MLVSLGMFVSCADDNLANSSGGEGNKGTSVTFNVSNAQDDAQNAMVSSVNNEGIRASFTQTLNMQGLVPEDLTSQKLPVQGGDGNACLIETTVAGVNPVKHDEAQTRANISTAITEKFSSIGYRGTSAAGISTTPWFHNKETNPNGTLVENIPWAWEQPYGRFYGISPQVTSAYPKLTVSPDTYAGTPYVDFEAETDAKKQKDLMTACSGVVQYATKGVAPTTNLAFRHALTAVRFKVGQNLSWNKTITKVEIINAKSKGRYTLATDENGTGAGWSNLSTPTTFTLDGVSVSTSQAVNQIIMGNTGDNYTFYMIPQSLTGVSVKIYFSDSATPAITANLSGSWLPGTTKTYALSQNNSEWQYQLSVTSPAVADYTQTTTTNYTVTSYRQLVDGTQQQPVAWKVVGYDYNGDGNFDMTEKPDWLTSLSKESGTGGTAAEAGTATLRNDVTDLVVARNNALQKATPLGSSSAPYDLSTKGGSVARSTANSYVISAPGSYQIPLVYGNAITSGNNNPSSYQTTVTGSYVLKNLKDHAGQNITSPWITLSNNGVNVPNGAKVVWADESGLVTNLAVTGSGTDAFVKFDVPTSAIKNGNAVIAVTKDGTVVWSWHLWFAPQDVLSTTEVTNYSGVKYKFTNETLGFKYTSGSGTPYISPRSVKVKVEQTVANGGTKQYGVITITQKNGIVTLEGYSTFYQFGRKDAFPGIDSPLEGTFVKNGGNKMSIQNSIQNPGTFYPYGTSWSQYNNYNFWSMNNNKAEENNNNNVVKTVYDPCPAGFKMPAQNAFTGFTMNGQNAGVINASGVWTNGWIFNNKITNPDATVYFSASGYRKSADGSLDYVNSAGYYWSAGPRDNLQGYMLYFNSQTVRPQYNYNRGWGFSVRPVAE